MTVKVGDTLYRLNTYGRSNDVRWTPVVIVGETKISWLYAPFGEKHPERSRINKKTMLTAADYRGIKDRHFTKQGAEDYDFCQKWQRPISQAVGTCTEVDQLKKIAEIIGMELG